MNKKGFKLQTNQILTNDEVCTSRLSSIPLAVPSLLCTYTCKMKVKRFVHSEIVCNVLQKKEIMMNVLNLFLLFLCLIIMITVNKK